MGGFFQRYSVRLGAQLEQEVHARLASIHPCLEVAVAKDGIPQRLPSRGAFQPQWSPLLSPTSNLNPSQASSFAFAVGKVPLVVIP